jgi:1D-myo-inositol 3-kinase
MIKAPALIVGHSCHDTLYLPNGTRTDTLGGSVSYISSIFNALQVGYEAVSKVGSDFAYFPQLGHRPHVVPESATTQFILDFTLGERSERVGAVCDPIHPQDVPVDRSYQVALAVGIAGEILPETLEKMSQCSRYLLCDIQGLVRVIQSGKGVQYTRLQDTAFYPLLDKISFLKASRQEASLMDLEEVRKRTCVLVTEGKDGCTVYQAGRSFRISAFPTEEIDPTGAGDCFLAGFSAGLLDGLPLEKAVLVGNYFGSLAVGQIGVPHLNGEIKRELLSCI